jgi:DNA-binding IclR family transcriptional regulator
MVKSVLKALDILNLVGNSDRELTISQIANNLGMNRTSVYRLVQSLEARGYLTKREDGNGYQIGLMFLPIAAKLLNTNKLRVEALPYLQDLANKCGERVNLGILHDGEVLYLGGIEKPSLPMVYSRFGKTAPAHCCSLGKIILAYLPEEEVDSLLDRKPLVRVTENTITDRHLFKQHLAEIRSQEYAIDHQEHVPGSYCISALIRGSRGQALGAVSISSGDLEKIKGYLKDLWEKAEVISHMMGFTLA